MAITVAQLLVKLNADTTGAEAGLARVGKLLGPGGALGTAVPLAAAAVAAGVVVIGGVAIKMAGDFQQSMTQLVTGAGESKNNLKLVSDGILQMARDTGESTQQLASGAFMIESAGYHGADALNVLKSAAEGAKVGNADLGTVSDATTTLMKDFGIKAGDSATAVNALIATVAQGKTHMQDLAMSLSEVAPTASAAGVSMNDMLGAMATMTGEGVPAANAATYLRQTILALSAPGTAAQKTLKDLGLSSADVANDLKNKGLPATLADITDRLGKKFPVGSAQYVAALKDISGGSRTMQGMLDLTGSHMKDFQTAVGGVSDQVKKGGSSVVGWSEVQKDFNFQFSRAKEVVETLMIQLGQHLLPAATQLFSFIADKAIPTITSFISWISGTSAGATAFKVVLIAVGGAIAGILVASFVAWAMAAGAAAIATIAATWPILAIGAGIALLIAGIVLLVSHSKEVGKFFSDIGDAIKQVVKQGIDFLLDKIAGLLGFLSKIPGPIGDMAKGALKGINDMKAGVNAALTDTHKTVTAHVEGMKTDAQKHVGEMAAKSVAQFDVMRAGLIDKIKTTKDEHQKHMLEMELATATHFESMKLKALAHTADWKAKHLQHMHDIHDQTGGILGDMGTIVGNVWGGIQAAFKMGVNATIALINGFISFLDLMQIHIPAIGVGPVKTPAFSWDGLQIPQIPYLAAGGDVQSAGLAVVGERGPEVVSLSSGARVTPLGSGAGAGGAGGQQTIIVQLDSQVLTRAVVKNMPAVIRLATGQRSF